MNPVQTASLTEKQIAERAEQRRYIAKARYRRSDVYKPRVWVVQDLLAIGWMNIWIGPEKSRKSTFALFMAMCIACGKPWFKFSIRRATSVVYFSAEDPSDELDLRYKKLLSLFSSEDQGLIETNLILIKGREMFVNRGIDITSDNPAFWASFIEEYPAEVYFLDALEMFTSGESNNELRESLVKLRNHCGSACLNVLHHTRKRDDRGIAQAVRLKNVGVRIWSDKCLGGGAIKRLADTIICQEYCEDRDKEGRVLDAETNFAAFGKSIEDVPCMGFKDGEEKCVFELVTKLGPCAEMSFKKLRGLGGPWPSMNAAALATGMGRSQGNDHVREMVRKGHLLRSEEGQVQLA